MGPFGWDEISYVTTVLRGVVVGTPHRSSTGPFGTPGDNDWVMNVKPAPGYEYLLTNQDGFTNTNGLVECEVEPPDKLPGGKDAETDSVVKEFIGHLGGLPVRVILVIGHVTVRILTMVTTLLMSLALVTRARLRFIPSIRYSPSFQRPIRRHAASRSLFLQMPRRPSFPAQWARPKWGLQSGNTHWLWCYEDQRGSHGGKCEFLYLN